MSELIRSKWHVVDSTAALHLALATNSPGVVHPIASSALPAQIQKMAGVSSYYVSGSATPQALTNGVTIGGEMVVARCDGALTKSYNFLFGTSSNGVVFSMVLTLALDTTSHLGKR